MSGRSETAVASMKAGGNCAQAVLSVFAGHGGLPVANAMKLATGFGAGMARQQEVCGAVTGGIMAIGLKHGQSRAEDKEAKEKTYRLTRELMARFKAEFGSCLCRELLSGCDLATEAGQALYKANDLCRRVCEECVRSAVRILEEIL